MKKSIFKTPLLILFFIVSILDILAIAFDQLHLRLIFKPLIIPVLALWYSVSVLKINRLFLIALFFSFLGDVLLLNSGNTFFVFGLSAFLLNHIFYLLLIHSHIKAYNTKDIVAASIPFVLIFVLVFSIIGKNLGSLFIPVLIYGITICTFGSLSFYNYLEKRNSLALLMLFGAVFFIVSDAMIGVEKFELQNKELAVGVMSTYVLAQFLICRYMIKKSMSI